MRSFDETDVSRLGFSNVVSDILPVGWQFRRGFLAGEPAEGLASAVARSRTDQLWYLKYLSILSARMPLEGDFEVTRWTVASGAGRIRTVDKYSTRKDSLNRVAELGGHWLEGQWFCLSSRILLQHAVIFDSFAILELGALE